MTDDEGRVMGRCVPDTWQKDQRKMRCKRWVANSVLYGCLLLAALCVLSLPASAALTPEAYRAALVESVELARQAAGSVAAPEAERLLRRARARFPEAAVVGTADRQITVDNRAAARLLDRAIRAKTAARRREAIRAFVGQAGMLAEALQGPAPARAPGELQALQSVLARGEFQQSALERWEERLQAWFAERLRQLFGNVEPAALEAIARILYWVILAVLVVLLAYLIWTYVPGLRFRRPGGAAQSGPAGEVHAPDTPGAHLQAAEEAAAAGRHLDALRHTYTAMLLLLDSASLVPYDRARTNREVLRALRSASHAPVREVLRPVTHALDEKLYGGRPATAEDYRWCRGEFTRLEGLLAP
jgi:hypothetical protein